MRTSGCSDQLVELDLNSLGVPVLRVLDQEDHQERDDGRSRVDDELPGIAESEERSGDDPDQDNGDGQREGSRPAAEA